MSIEAREQHPSRQHPLLLHFERGELLTEARIARERRDRRGDDRRMRIDDHIRLHGGLVPTFRLLRRGWSGRDLARSVHTGQIVRVRQGWYSVPETKDVLLRAARVGGRLTCSAAAAELGLWTPTPNPPLHVAVPSHASRLRHPSDHRVRLDPSDTVRVHWDLARGGTSFVVDALATLLDMADCEPIESVIAAADSALAHGLISRRRWRSAVAHRHARLRARLDDLDPASGSYVESLVRTRLHRMGIRPRTQVQLEPKLRVDFVIGRRLIVEIDGSWHAGIEQFREDRRRDMRASILGFRRLRFSAAQALYEWPQVWASIDSAIRRGDAG